MGYYIDQFAEEDRQRRLADLLAEMPLSGGTYQNEMNRFGNYPAPVISPISMGTYQNEANRLGNYVLPDPRDARDLGAMSTGGGLPPAGYSYGPPVADPVSPPPDDMLPPPEYRGESLSRTPVRPFLEAEAPPPPLPQNYIRNERTGKVMDLGPSQLPTSAGAMLDYSAPVEMGGVKGYFLKGDRTRALLADGRIMDFGRDTAAERQRQKEMTAQAKAGAELVQAGQENEVRRRALMDDDIMRQTGKMTVKQYEARHGKLPSGFELFHDEQGRPDIRPIQGGKQYQELMDRMNKFNSAIKGFEEYQTQISTLSDHPGREAATGFSSIVNPVVRQFAPGTDQATFLNELKTFTSQAFLSNIDKLRGTGPLSNMEGEKLQAAVGNLDPSSDEATFVKNLNLVKQKFANLQEIATKEAMQAAMDLKRPDYSGVTRAEKPPAAPPPTAPAAPATGTGPGSPAHKADWMARAKQKNPNMSGAALEAKYLERFGSR